MHRNKCPVNLLSHLIGNSYHGHAGVREQHGKAELSLILSYWDSQQESHWKMSSDVAEPSVGTCIFIIPLFHYTEMNNTPILSVHSYNERKGTLPSIGPVGFSSVCLLLKTLAAQESRTEQHIGSHEQTTVMSGAQQLCLLLVMKLWFIFNFLKVWLYTSCRTKREAASPHNRKRCPLLNLVKNPSPLCLVWQHLKHILRNVEKSVSVINGTFWSRCPAIKGFNQLLACTHCKGRETLSLVDVEVIVNNLGVTILWTLKEAYNQHIS